jgi:hypothetical protein
MVQDGIGTVVKTGEDDDPIAVMTALNTQQYKSSPFMQAIKQFLVARCPKGKQQQDHAQLLQQVGA